MQKVIVGLIFLLAAGAGGYLALNLLSASPDLVEIDPVETTTFTEVTQGDTEESTSNDALPDYSDSTEETDPIDPSETQGNLPLQFNLAVPFTSQAPTGDWNLPYQEACEETSIYMVSEYYAGNESAVLPAEIAESEINELVRFQEDFMGFYLDTTAAETAQVIDHFYGYTARVVENPTVDQIKAEIAAGRPVIIPAAGRKLPNPYFSGEGPLYHMLVIKGYTEGTFITNDPGTRNGADFVYRQSDLMSAIGDWNNGDPVNGAKVVIFTDR